MTYSYVEYLLLDKFLDIPSISIYAKSCIFWDKNEEEMLEHFKDKEYVVDDELSLIVDSKETFVDWIRTYPEFPDWHNDEDDIIVLDVNEYVLTSNDKYNENGLIKAELFPSVCLENIEFTRPDDNYWYEVSFIPAIPLQIELGTKGRVRWTGILSVNVCVPKNGGSKDSRDRYDEIKEMYRDGRIWEGVRIYRAYRTSGYEDGDYYILPVTIEWQSDLER